MDEEIRKYFNKFKTSGKVADYLEYRKIVKKYEQKKR